VAGAGPGIDTATPAVVLKFDPNVMHHGGLGAIRSLGRLGVKVYGVHEARWAPAAHSRYLSGRLFWRPRTDDSQRIAAGLIRLAGRIGRRAVLIPTDDAAAIFLAERGAALREHFLFPAPPPDLPRRLAGKHSLSALCQELGVPSPRACLPASLAQALGFAASAGYPLVAKQASPWLAGQPLRSTSIVADEPALTRAYRAFEAANAGVMLQEFIPASRGGDWFCHGYCDAGSVCRPAFTGVKERSYPAYTGLTSLGHAARNDTLAAQATAMFAATGYAGIADLDFRRDPRDGRYKLLDFNPRLGAQFRLFRDSAGLDVVVAAYLDLTGQPLPSGEQVNGRRFLVENYDPLGALRYWRDRELTLSSWLASVRGTDETAWFARDDLRPFGLMCVRMGWRAVSRRFTRRPAGLAH
jgi:D-aspartate ligase